MDIVNDHPPEHFAFWRADPGTAAVDDEPRNLKAPVGEEDCTDAMALICLDTTGRGVLRTAYKPTPDEIVELAAGGTLWFSSWGQMPVHRLDVQPSGGDPDELTHVALSVDSEYESVFVYRDEPGSHDDTDRTFEADIPERLVATIERSSAAYSSAVKEATAAAAFDPNTGRMVECCSRWAGRVTPGRTSWHVKIAASDDDEDWPLVDHFISSASSEIEARRLVEGLPEEVWCLAGYSGNPVLITRDRITVEESTWPASTSGCYRCGWDRADHADMGSTVD